LEKKMRLLAKALLGGLAGVAGTGAMSVAMQALYRKLPVEDRYPLPPRQITERLVGEQTDGVPIKTILAHFGYGALAGALLGVVRPSAGGIQGIGFGLAVWTASYLGWIPALHVLKPATRHPLRRNLLMLATHVVWGGATAVVLRALWGAKDGAFSGGVARDAPATGAARPPALR
jgi:hypothetical protein